MKELADLAFFVVDHRHPGGDRGEESINQWHEEHEYLRDGEF